MASFSNLHFLTTTKKDNTVQVASFYTDWCAEVAELLLQNPPLNT